MWDVKHIKTEIENLKYDKDLIIQQKATFHGLFNKNSLNKKLTKIDERLVWLQKELRKAKTRVISQAEDSIYIQEVKMGDTYNMSGDFRNTNLSIKSTLVNVSQSIHTSPDINEPIKRELSALVDQLNQELQNISSEKSNEIEAVAETTKSLVKTANKEKPNEVMLQVEADGLMQAAKNLATVAPIILTIATQIVATIMKMLK